MLLPFAKAYSGLDDEEIRRVDAVVRRTIVQTLRNIGFYQIHEAADGEAGIQALKSMTHCDVVLSDISMKPVGGLKVLERVRSELSPPACDVPVVFVTGHGDVDTVVQAKRLSRSFAPPSPPPANTTPASTPNSPATTATPWPAPPCASRSRPAHPTRQRLSSRSIPAPCPPTAAVRR